jgi:hypothetical protein
MLRPGRCSGHTALVNPRLAGSTPVSVQLFVDLVTLAVDKFNS